MSWWIWCHHWLVLCLSSCSADSISSQLSHWECFWWVFQVIQAKITRFKMHTLFIHNLLISVWPFDHLLFVRMLLKYFLSAAVRFSQLWRDWKTGHAAGIVGQQWWWVWLLRTKVKDAGSQKSRVCLLVAERNLLLFEPRIRAGIDLGLTVADVDDPPDLWSVTGFSMCVS